MQENKFRQPLFIIFSAIVMLYLVSFIQLDYDFFGFQLRPVDIFIDMKPIPGIDIPFEEPDTTQSSLHYQNIQRNIAAVNPVQAFSSIEKFLERELEKSGRYAVIISQGKSEPVSGNIKNLKSFFNSLSNSKTKTVRVAHYGDSIIEGDLVTADIRDVLQTKFGGEGVGWLGIISQDINFRITTKHSFGGEWETAALYSRNPKSLPLGISGEVAIPKGEAWVRYESASYNNRTNDFSIVRLFYSNAGNSKMYYSFNNGPRQSADLQAGGGLQELVMKATGKAHSVKLEFPTADQAYIYGVSLENGTGVYVDNFPIRANSGVDLNRISSAMLNDFGKHLDYNLILLEFGQNIEGSYRTDYTWYAREMGKVVKHFQDAYPNAGIILLGVHDRAMKRGSEFVTDPGVLSLLETQKRIAAQSNIAFFSLFDAMGGMNSMTKWVLASPPLAYKDYVHFNNQGAAKLARLFTEALLNEYENKR